VFDTNLLKPHARHGDTPTPQRVGVRQVGGDSWTSAGPARRLRTPATAPWLRRRPNAVRYGAPSGTAGVRRRG